jgi:hypothetical protein
LHHEAFTNFYEFSRENTLGFSLAWFTEFCEIAKGNKNLVSEDPTWWAHAQAHALLSQELGVPERSTGFPFWRIRRWIQYFCDGDQPADAIDTADLETAEGFIRFATRFDWRAPKWLWAWAIKYYGRDSAPWKSLKTEAASMERLGEQETEKLLTKITSHFWEHIQHRLSDYAARGSIDDAKTGVSIPDTSGLPVPANGAKAAIKKENGPVIWPGTARQLGDEIYEQYRKSKIAAKSERDALNKACQYFVRKDGTAFKTNSIIQSLKNRQEIEKKDAAPRPRILSTLVKRFANVTAS